MKKTIIYIFALSLISTNAFALDTVFDSADRAIEVKYAPVVSTTKQAQVTKQTASVTTTNTKNSVFKSTIKEEKFNSALTNLDDAQVELRQELTSLTARYNDSLIEKEKACQVCKNLKAEIKAINKKMRNVEKSKKMINKNLETT